MLANIRKLRAAKGLKKKKTAKFLLYFKRNLKHSQSSHVTSALTQKRKQTKINSKKQNRTINSRFESHSHCKRNGERRKATKHRNKCNEK